MGDSPPSEGDPFAGDTRPAGIQPRHCSRCGTEQQCRIDGDRLTRTIEVPCLACGNEWTNQQ
jgi:hypothetical protein